MKEEDLKYLKELFKYFKDKVNSGILVLDSDSYYKISNLQIIESVANELQKPIDNFLIVLNKIDLSKNKEIKIKECRQFFVDNINVDIFNTYNTEINTFIPMDSRQLVNFVCFQLI